VTVGPDGSSSARDGQFRVALTFDAEHPDRRSRHGVSEELIEKLDREKIRASFFIQGRWAEAYPDAARQIPAGGHFVGNHSFYHARMPLLSDSGLAGVDDPRVISGLAALGYRNVGWDVVATDWEPDMAGQVESAVVDGGLAHGDGAIVLLHTWPAGTLAALPGIARRLRDRGAEFVRVDELERIPELRAGDVAPVPE
jgi:peptidoglycan/xylan/chitin deacetylase (PgdA/CDA1 family)